MHPSTLPRLTITVVQWGVVLSSCSPVVWLSFSYLLFFVVVSRLGELLSARIRPGERDLA